MIPISQPALGAAEQQAVARVLDSSIIAQGPRVAEFERAFAEFIGVRHAIATNNGTSALYTALLAHGIGAGDEVITTPFTFIASINAILYTGASPVLVDVDETFNINPTLIASAVTPRTRAILPVHLYGQPADLDAITALARRQRLVVIEDACQAHGATFAGRRVGSFGAGCFSFYATKNMTTGEGGMLTTDDDALAERARLLINHGMRVRYHHETRGYNFRLTDLAAAIGLEQLKQLSSFNARRGEHAEFYGERLSRVPGLIVPTVAPRRTHVWHQYTLRVTPEFPLTRDALIEKLRAAGIGADIYYPVPAHQQHALRDIVPADTRFPMAEQCAREVISIPVHPRVTDANRAYIARTLEAIADLRVSISD